MLLSQVVNGIMLPFTVVPILLFVNSKKLMGDYVNGKIYNYVCWIFMGLITALSLLYLVMQFAGKE